MPVIGLVIDGAMQHAPQSGRQSMGAIIEGLFALIEIYVDYQTTIGNSL